LALIARDITEHKRAEEERLRLQAQLLQTQKLEALGTLAGGIAHDFNNILVGILGYAELAQLEPALSPAARERLQQIMRGAERARDLVRQILTFSRKQPAQRLPVRLAAVVEEAFRFLRAGIPATVAIDVKLPGDGPVVLADPTQIQQIVINLCTNAVQAMSERGGRLLLSVDSMYLTERHPPLKPGPYARLTVADTGCGMDANTLQHLFEPFFTTKKNGGTGLGLAVVHGIVELHGGAVAVDSQTGQGTTFHIYLPIESRQPTLHAAATTAPSQGRGQWVLVVDDEPVNVAVATEMLKALGYQPQGYDDPAAALVAFRADPNRFALVLTDLAMPRLTGPELAQSLRQLRPNLPVLLMTGYSDSISQTKACECGFGAVVHKPFTLQKLGDAMELCLRLRAGPNSNS
jgi:nitrogen-specific signal transduction histidine kinase/CheY-like chemotaxis protein